MTQGTARPLYQDAPNPDGYEMAARGEAREEAAPSGIRPYAPVQLSGAPKHRAQVLLFTIGNRGSANYYEGSIPDPVPARHYARMLLDVSTYGVVEAEARMINAVIGEENLARLAACEDMEAEQLLAVMEQVAERAAGPYRQAQGKSVSA